GRGRGRRLGEAAGRGVAGIGGRVVAGPRGGGGIGDLGVAAGVSSTHLAQWFKEFIGVTPKRWPAPTVSPPPCSRSTPPGRSTGATLPVAQATSTRPTSATSSGRSPGLRRPGTSKSGGGSCANIPAARWTAGRCWPIDFLQERQLTTANLGAAQSRGGPRGQGGHVQLGVGGRLRRRRQRPARTAVRLVVQR